MFSYYSKFIETKVKPLVSRTAKLSTFPAGNKKLPLINDTYLLLTALKTYGNYNTSEKSHHTFTRLAFLGDSILGYNVADHLHEKFPSYSNGKLSLYRSMLVSSFQLSTFARQWGLDEIAKVDLILAKKNNRILGEALEAYIGAFYLDCCQLYGMRDAHMRVRKLCIDLIDPVLDLIIKTWKVWIALFDYGAIQEKKTQERVQRMKLHQAAIKAIIKEIEIPEETANKKVVDASKELTQKQVKAKETIKKKSKIKNVQPAKNLSHDLMAKSISKEIESNHQMLKELKRQKKKQAELKKLSVKQLLTRLRRLV